MNKPVIPILVAACAVVLALVVSDKAECHENHSPVIEIQSFCSLCSNSRAKEIRAATRFDKKAIRAEQDKQTSMYCQRFVQHAEPKYYNKCPAYRLLLGVGL